MRWIGHSGAVDDDGHFAGEIWADRACLSTHESAGGPTELGESDLAGEHEWRAGDEHQLALVHGRWLAARDRKSEGRAAYSHAMSEQALEDAALIYEATAEELEQAARHCRTAAQHFRDREIPRAAAHAWAAFGHMQIAEELARRSGTYPRAQVEPAIGVRPGVVALPPCA